MTIIIYYYICNLFCLSKCIVNNIIKKHIFILSLYEKYEFIVISILLTFNCVSYSFNTYMYNNNTLKWFFINCKYDVNIDWFLFFYNFIMFIL